MSLEQPGTPKRPPAEMLYTCPSCEDGIGQTFYDIDDRRWITCNHCDFTIRVPDNKSPNAVMQGEWFSKVTQRELPFKVTEPSDEM